MEKIKTIQILDGKFIPENAKKVLMSLLQSKIEFHRNYISSGDLLFAEKRINELEHTKTIVENTINDVLKNNKKIIMEGVITLKIVD